LDFLFLLSLSKVDYSFCFLFVGVINPQSVFFDSFTKGKRELFRSVTAVFHPFHVTFFSGVEIVQWMENTRVLGTIKKNLNLFVFGFVE